MQFAMRPLGQTYALSVANTKHADVLITANDTERCVLAAFENTGATDVVIVIAPNGNATPAVTFPVEGTPSGATCFVLHSGAVNQPKIVPVPAGGSGGPGFNVSAIGSAAGPSVLYVTPVGPI